MRHLFLQMGILLAIINIPLLGSAQVGVSPPVVEIAGAARNTRSITLNVVNQGNQAADMQISMTDLLVTLDGRPSEAPTPSVRSCLKWMTVTPMKARLEAHASQSVTVSFKFPADASGGYSALFLVDLLSQKANATVTEGMGAAISFSHRAIVPVVAHVRNLKRSYPNIEVTEIKLLQWAEVSSNVQSLFNGKTGAVAVATIRNSGEEHIRLAGDLIFRTANGVRLSTTPLMSGMGYVLAGCERQFPALISWPIPDGLYIMGADLRPLGGSRSVISRTTTLAIQNGMVVQGEVSPELKATLQALQPLYIAQPDELVVEVPAGGKTSQQVRLIGLQDSQGVLEPRQYTWKLDEKGNIVFQPVMDNSESLKQLSIRPTPLTLNNGKALSCAVSCSLPRNANEENYFALLMAYPGEVLSSDDYTLMQRAILVSLRPKNKCEPKILVSNLVREDLNTEGQRIKFNLKNEGTQQTYTMLKATASLNGTPLEDLPVSNAPIRLLADGQRDMEITWPRLLQPGKYEIIITAGYLVGDKSVYADAKIEFEIAGS